MTQELLDMALALPSADKEELIRELRISLATPEEKTIPEGTIEWTDRLLAIAAAVLGVERIEDDRRVRNVFGRKMVAWELREEGLTLEVIGDLLGKDHSSVSYMLNEKDSMMRFPAVYEKELDYWTRFKKAVNYADI